MDKIKCITFDPAAQEALPDHIKAKMKAARAKARLEAYPNSKQDRYLLINKFNFFELPRLRSGLVLYYLKIKY